jgi:hypothetical protein
MDEHVQLWRQPASRPARIGAAEQLDAPQKLRAKDARFQTGHQPGYFPAVGRECRECKET